MLYTFLPRVPRPRILTFRRNNMAGERTCRYNNDAVEHACPAVRFRATMAAGKETSGGGGADTRFALTGHGAAARREGWEFKDNDAGLSGIEPF